MKVTTLLSITGGLAVGYVFGTAAGRPRYEQLSQGAHDLLQHPQVQQTVFDLAGTAKANAHRLPGPGAGVADRAATRVQDSLTRPDDLAEAPAPVAPDVAP